MLYQRESQTPPPHPSPPFCHLCGPVLCLYRRFWALWGYFAFSADSLLNRKGPFPFWKMQILLPVSSMISFAFSCSPRRVYGNLQICVKKGWEGGKEKRKKLRNVKEKKIFWRSGTLANTQFSQVQTHTEFNSGN